MIRFEEVKGGFWGLFLFGMDLSYLLGVFGVIDNLLI